MCPPDDILDAAAGREGQAGVEPDGRERRLNAAIRELIEAREAGLEPDREAWLAKHQDLREELAEYLDTDDQLNWVVHGAGPAEPASGVRFGPYRIIREIGRGGMGIVYEAEEAGTGRRLALKVLPCSGLPDPAARERFDREAEALKRLGHPNVMPILDFLPLGRFSAIAMPLIEGRDLRTICHQLERAQRGGSGGGLDPGRARPEYLVAHPDQPADTAKMGGDSPGWRAIALIGLQAARALSHAHERGVLHRDVKPSNLVLDRAGRVLLTDFGLAGRVDVDQPDLTATGELAGTLRYLAPERLRGWCDPASDVYSLGLTLYELLALRPAFDDVDRTRLLQAIATTTPPRLRKLRTDIPLDLETIVLKAIEKVPAHRYHTAEDLAEDLRRFVEGKPIQARRPGLIDRASRWTQQHGSVVAGGFAALFVISLILTISLVRIRDEQQKALNAAKVASSEEQKALDAARIASQEKQKAVEADQTAAREKLNAINAARDSRYESER
jgi:serine/threonine protein kinase